MSSFRFMTVMVYNGSVLQYCIVYRQVQNFNITNKFITNNNFKWLDIYVVHTEKEKDHKGIMKSISVMNFQYRYGNSMIKGTHDVCTALCNGPITVVITQ